MLVCICNGVSDKAIRAAVESGCVSLDSVQAQLGVANQCGTCADVAREIIQEARQVRTAGGSSVQYYPGNAIPA